MVKHFFPLLLVSTVMVSGCVNRTPPIPPLTEVQFSQALAATESRLSQQMAQQCQEWQQQQQTHSEHFQSIHTEQRQLDNKLDSLDQKLSQMQTQSQAVVVPAKAAQCPPMPSSSKSIGNKLIVGEVEWLWIEAVNRVYEARVDTGATTSSISALDITPFEKDGKRWVRFRLSPDDSGDSFEVEAPLVRYVRIRQASTDELDRRPVAKLTVRLGKMTEVGEFTLNDRTEMNYPILLGREFLKDIAIVDVARKNAQPKPEIVSGQPQISPVSKDKNK